MSFRLRDKQKNLRRLFALLTALLLLPGLPLSARAALPSAALVAANGSQTGMVRVFLSSLGNPATLNLTVQGSYTVNGKSTLAVASGSALTVNFNASTGALTLIKDGVSTNMGNAFKLRRHQTSGDNGVKIAQSRAPSNLYPGDISFVVKANGSAYKLYTIVYVYMEDYLYGVLPYEMGNSSHIEALKAQAVSARTYTLRAMTSAVNALYDVVDTASDQMYSGTSSGNANCRAAVDQTKGIIAKNGSAFTGTWYTASNGGQTESVKNVWGSSGYAYLRIKDDPYDLQNPDARVKSFTVNAGASQGNSALGSLLSSKASSTFGAGASITAVTAVVPHTPKYAEPSRLYTKLDFMVSYMQNGVSRQGTLSFNIFDELESPLNMSIQSAQNELWTVTAVSGGFKVEARRYGHGIGMSQRGAMQMGRLGYTYDQILAFYFEGCVRMQYTLTNTILSPVVSGMDSYEITTEEPAAPLEEETSCRALITLSSNGALAPLRFSPNDAGKVLTKAQNGAEVTVLGETNGWCLVRFGEISGYVQRAALTISGTIPVLGAHTATALYGYAATTASLNLRQTASDGGTLLTTMPQGAALPILSVSNGWARVQYGRLCGYASLSFLALSSEYPETAYNADQVGATITADTPFYFSKSLTGYVLSYFTAGTEVAVISDDGSWAEVRRNKVTAYVLSARVQRTYKTTAQSEDDALGAGEYYMRVANTKALNLREAASETAAIMTEMPFDARLIVMEKGAAWTKVRYRGVVGYAMNTYLSADTSATPTPTATAGTLRAVVTTTGGTLNLRESMSKSSKILDRIPNSTSLTILERGTEWSKTTYGGLTGYVMNEFLTFIGTATPTPTPTASTSPTASPTNVVVDPSAQPLARVTTAGGNLHMRVKPLSNSKAITKLPNGTVVTVLEMGANWYLIEFEGTTGYSQAKYLTILGGDLNKAKAVTVSDDAAIKNDNLDNHTVVVTSGVNAENEAAGENAAADENAAAGEPETLPAESDTFPMETAITPEPAASEEPTAQPETDKTKYNEMRDDTMEPLEEVLFVAVQIESGRLNLRKGCSTKSEIVVKIEGDDHVIVTMRGKEWCFVEFEGQQGYVMTRYLVLPDV